MNDIELVFNDEGDWMGVYKDGYLAYEGHGIEPNDLLNLCGVPYRSRYDYKMDDSRLPPLLSNVR